MDAIRAVWMLFVDWDGWGVFGWTVLTRTGLTRGTAEGVCLFFILWFSEDWRVRLLHTKGKVSFKSFEISLRIERNIINAQ